MNYRLSTENVEITTEDRVLMDKKFERLEKILLPPYVVDVRITHDTHHRTGAVVNCIINIEQGKRVFHTERVADTVQTAVDDALSALHQELQRYHEDSIQRRRQIRRTE